MKKTKEVLVRSIEWFFNDVWHIKFNLSNGKEIVLATDNRDVLFFNSDLIHLTPKKGKKK